MKKFKIEVLINDCWDDVCGDYIEANTKEEASKHKYVEFITNTYADLHLPYIDTSYMYPFGYALRIPNRVIKKYNRRTKSFYFVEDKISKSFQLTDFSTIDTASILSDYYSLMSCHSYLK